MKSLSTDGGAHSPDEGLNAGRVGEGAEQRVGGSTLSPTFFMMTLTCALMKNYLT